MSNLAVNAAFSGSGTLRQHRFKRVLRRVEDRVGKGRSVQRLSLSSAGHLYRREGATDRQQASSATEERSLLVTRDQLVVNPMWLTGGSIAVSSVEGAVSPDYRVFTADKTQLDARYLHHLLRSEPYRDQYNLFVRANTTFDRRIQQIDLDQMPLWLPAVDEQRRIADFLDDRVAHIDQIVAARGTQLVLIDEVVIAATSQLLGTVGPEGPPLGAVCRIVDTEHKTAPTVTDGGHWIAGTGAIRDGRLVHDRLRETDSDSFSEWTSRGVPEPGDVLLTREAPVGEVALLSDEDPPVAIGQRVVLLKPNAKALDSGFLRLVLMAGEMRRIISMASAGSLHPHLNMADISRLRIPNSSLEEQHSLGRAHQQILTQAQAGRGTLERYIDRLTEYRQSLITAAVTGEIDVSTTGSGIPG